MLHIKPLDKIILVIAFFTTTPIVLFSGLFTLSNLSKPDLAPKTPAVDYTGAYIYSAGPYLPSLSAEIKTEDARSEIVRQYLHYYESPLEPFADFIVTTADKYGLDFRLITAIAQQESNLCKKIPPGSYNCWGWGIHSRGTLGFGSFSEGIEVVSYGLKKDYIDKGYVKPTDIMTKYTPLSNGSWAEGVNAFLTDML